jgi:mono/diheme cytochrome c family protein
MLMDGVRGQAVIVAFSSSLLLMAGSARAQDQPQGPTFAKDVAPIFYKHCTSCHRPGDIAPMSLLNYADAVPWARAIQKRVLDRSMPPWFADPRYGKFQNERRLSESEIDTIVKWVSSGTRQGNPADLPPAPQYAEGWTIGTPDAVFAIQEYEIPATGAIDLQVFQVPTGFTEDKWIQAVEIRPGNRSQVHHVTMYYREPEPGIWVLPPAGAVATTQPERLSNSLAVYAGGTDPLIFPPGAARRMRAGSVLLFEIHYLTNGAPARDRTRLGLRFASQRPTDEIQAFTMSHSGFVIPPGNPDYVVQTQAAFDRPLKIWSILPHMHLRGKSFEYRLVHPDGRSEIILSVPRWDSHWEASYAFVEPLTVPAGTIFEATAHFDNSAANRTNPDPSQEVRWGWKPSEEMMFSYVTFSAISGADGR